MSVTVVELFPNVLTKEVLGFDLTTFFTSLVEFIKSKQLNKVQRTFLVGIKILRGVKSSSSHHSSELLGSGETKEGLTLFFDIESEGV